MRLLPACLLTLTGAVFAPPAFAAAPPTSRSIGGMPTLLAGLKDRDVKVRRQAALVLGARGARAREAMPALIAAFKDTDLEVRVRAAAAIGKIGEPALDSLA